jgi:hypothetical protein
MSRVKPELTGDQVGEVVSSEAYNLASCANEGQGSAIVIKPGIKNGKPVLYSEVLMLCGTEDIKGDLAALKEAILTNKLSTVWKLKASKRW